MKTILNQKMPQRVWAKILFFLCMGLVSTTLFTACDDDDDVAPPPSLVPITVTIAEVETGNFEGQVVRIENVQFNEPVGTQFNGTNSNANGSRTLADCDGNTTTVFTDAGDVFSNEELPRGNGAIVALASSFNNNVQLRLQSLDGVAEMTGPRCEEDTDCEETNGSFTNICAIRGQFNAGNAEVQGTDIIISGTVTSDASGGNINSRNIAIEDATAGIIVRFEADHSFALGDQLEIDITGQELSQFNDLVQVNNVPLSAATSTGTTTPSPQVVTIPELNSGDFESQLISLENVTFVDADGSTTFGAGENREVTDGTNTTIVRINNAAVFANDVIPSGAITITGNASVFQGDVQLVPRNRDDLGLSGGGGGGDATLETIANVRALFTGTETNVSDNIKIQGVITSDGASMNLPDQNAFIQDASGAIAIRFTGAHSFVLGDEVEITIQNIELSEFNDLLQLTNIPNGNATKVGDGTLPTPASVTITQVLSGNFEAQLVQLSGVQFDSETGTYSGGRTLTNCTDDLPIFTRSQATFADDNVPTGNGTIVGIASTFNGEQLVIRNTSDVDFSGAREDCGNGGGGEATPESIADVRARFDGGASNITDNIKIQGVVTSDKDNGSITGRNLYIQDESGAIVIRFSGNHDFARDAQIEVNLQGASFTEFNELLQIETANANASEANLGLSISPEVINVTQLLSGDFEAQLVTLQSVSFDEADGALTFGSNQSRMVTGALGSFVVFTRSAFTDLVNTVLPSGTGNLTGLATTFNGPQLILRDVNEIDFP